MSATNAALIDTAGEDDDPRWTLADSDSEATQIAYLDRCDFLREFEERVNGKGLLDRRDPYVRGELASVLAKLRQPIGQTVGPVASPVVRLASEIEEQIAELEQIKPAGLSGVMTWAEWRDTAPESVDWLVHGIIAKGSQGFLAARPKGGKSWLNVDLAVSVATGTQFLGRFDVQKQPVLYVCLEGSQSSMRARMGAVARGKGIDPDSDDLELLHMRGRGPINLSDLKYAQEIIETARELNVGLVIIDTLRKAAPAIRESGDGSTDFALLVANLAELPSLGCAVVFTHHFVKVNDANGKRSLGEMISGSGALFGHADFVVGITKTEKQDGRISTMALDFEGREDATPAALTVTLEGAATTDTGGWGYRDTLTLAVDEAAASKPPKPNANELRSIRILTWMADQARPVRPSEILTWLETDGDPITDSYLTKIRKDYLDPAPGFEIVSRQPDTRWQYTREATMPLELPHG